MAPTNSPLRLTGGSPPATEDDYENAGGMDYYQCIYDAELSDSTSELVPVGVVSPGSFYTTTKAGVLNGCETHDGFIRFSLSASRKQIFRRP